MKIGLVVLAAVWLVLIATSWGQAAPPPSNSDEYNFSWLDPDKKIYVLQNRKYLKAGHLMVSAMGGVASTSPYLTTYNVQPRLSFFLSEAFGIETFYTLMSNSENGNFDALKQASPSTNPLIREIRSQYGVLLNYVPWYAKINVFNKILYFDWYFSGGAGTIQSALDRRQTVSAPHDYVEQSTLGVFAGTGHIYHLTQDFSVRLDMTASFYRAPNLGTSGDKIWFSNYLFAIGLGYRL